MKVCSKCGVIKDANNFHKQTKSLDGLQSRCKECVQQYQKSDEYRKIDADRRWSDNGISWRKKHQKFSLSKYNKSTKGKVAHLRRRERKHNLDLVLTPLEINMIYKRFDHQCFKCKTTTDLTLDHHLPLSKGHGLSLSNAVLLCKSCNSRKHDRLPEDFYTSSELEHLNCLLGLAVS
jgi:5-methylcytosine-specific restriction endonuclease McrA